MTSPKTVSWSALVNLGNDESLGLTVTGEATNPDEARDIFAFACGQLLGVANSADAATAALVRAYVSRLVTEEEAKPAVRGEQAPKVKWEPKITKPEWDRAQAAKQDAAPKTTPTIEEQAKAAVAQCVKPPAPAPQPTPSAPLTPGASAPAERPTAPQPTASAPDGEVCGACGAAVTKSQAKLSQLFLNKIACKSCMDKMQGGAP